MTPTGAATGLGMVFGAAALGGYLMAACALSSTRTLEVGAPARRPVGMPATCADGGAPRVLTDPACAAACGWSCLPGR